MTKHLLLVLFILFNVRLSHGQSLKNEQVKARYHDKPLSLVLLDIELNHRLTFEVDRSRIKDYRITCRLNKVPLEKALDIILHGTDLGFDMLADRTVRIYVQHNNPDVGSQPVVARRRDFTVSGKVNDEATGESLPFATVYVKGTTLGTETNSDGYFSIFGVPSDTSTLVVHYLGYEPAFVPLRPSMNMANLFIRISADHVQLKEVVVAANKADQIIRASTGISRISLSPGQLSTLPSYGEQDVFRSLQLLPGVSGSNESSSGLYIRGGTPDQNLVLFDGFTVYHVDHLFGFFSAFNADAIKDIQLYKGGFDAKYGGRLSSVVEMTGKDGNTESFHAGAGISLLSYHGYAEAPFDSGRGSILVTGRRSFQTKFYSNLFDAFAGTNNTGQPQALSGRGRLAQQDVQPNSYFYDLNAKVTYRLGSKDVLSLSFYNGEDDLDNSRNTNSNAFGNRFGGGTTNFTFDSNNSDLSNWGNIGSSLKYSHKWSDRFYTKANISYSNYFSERDRGNQTTITREDTTIHRNIGTNEFNDLRDFTLRVDNELRIGRSNQLDFGIQSTYNDIKYRFIQNDTIDLISRADEGMIGSAYLQDRFTVSDDLILKGGLRGTYYSPTNQVYFEPRASITYLITDRLKFKGAFGKYFQFANRIIREDIQQGSRDFWLLADADRIPIGKATHFIGGLSYETKDFLFDVESYYKNLEGLSEYSTRLTNAGSGPNRSLSYEESFYTGTGVAKGVEFLLQKKSGHLTGWLGYTLGEVKYDFADFGQQPFFASQDQTHEFKMVLNYKVGSWDLASTFIYATGRPYTAPTGYYELPLLDGTTESYFEVSDKNSLRLPDYHRLDLSATYHFSLGSSKCAAGLSLINLYNRRNVWYKEYEVIEGELLVTDISLIDFTPSIFISWDLK